MAELAEQVAGLRALADFLEAHPDFHSSWETVRYASIVQTAPEFVSLVRQMGPGEKGDLAHINKLTFTCKFGGGVTIEAWVPKEATCQRKVTQETVTKLVPPADVELVEVTETVEKVEWVCPSSFLGLAPEVAS